MVHLTKCQIIVVNLIKGQIRTINFNKPYPFNMANLIKPWPFDKIFNLTLGKTCHFSQMYWTNVTCVFHALNI